MPKFNTQELRITSRLFLFPAKVQLTQEDIEHIIEHVKKNYPELE